MIPELRSGVPGPSWVDSRFFGDSDTNTQSCSEAESTRRFDNRDKVTGKFTPKVKKRKAPGEPTIEELLRPLPEQLDELEAAPTTQSIAFALEWLEDIDTIRGKSSYQGVMSKRMKDRMKAVKKTMQILSRRIEEKGDLAYYKRKNAELQAQLLASQKELEKMNHRINGLQTTIEELRSIVVSGGDLPFADKAMSPMEEGIGKEKDCSRKADDVQTSSTKVIPLGPVMRPPIKGISTPIPSRTGSGHRVDLNEDAELSRQIVELMAHKKRLRQKMKDEGSGRSADPSPSAGQPGKKAKVIADIQIVLPTGNSE